MQQLDNAAVALEVVGTENGDSWPKFQSMGGACGTRPIWRGGIEEDGPRYSKVNAMKEQRGMSRSLNNHSDISLGNALPDQALAATSYRIR